MTSMRPHHGNIVILIPVMYAILRALITILTPVDLILHNLKFTHAVTMFLHTKQTHVMRNYSIKYLLIICYNAF